ncbi:Transposase [Nostoc sp. DSM 114161]|jgi:hypothetical protein|uniref:hypothetical protein n=1 Tax=Nostoc sp. DSM 114161 TaxID=3440143 RepID=UPI004045C537
MDGLYDREILKVDASLRNHGFRLWTFIALNPGNENIRVAKTVEDKIFSVLSLWYFGSRKIQINAPNDTAIQSSRKLLNFFAAERSTAQWPGCKKAYDNLYAGFNINGLYGRDHDTLSADDKKELVRSRFAAVLAAGIPKLSNESLSEKISSDISEPTLDSES